MFGSVRPSVSDIILKGNITTHYLCVCKILISKGQGHEVKVKGHKVMFKFLGHDYCQIQ